MKPIRLSAHAVQYQAPRGFTAVEAEEAIRTMPWQPAEGARLEVRKDSSFAGTLNGRFFQTKQVRPIFVE